MKLVGILILGLVVFLVAIIGPVAATGKLNPESISRLLGREEAEEPTVGGHQDLSPLALKMNEEQNRLREWESRLGDEEARLAQRERDLDLTLDEITEAQTQVVAALDQLDAEQQAAVQSIAKTMESMNAQNAAADLSAMSPEDAARILPLIKDRNRGKILDAMDAANRSLILEVMQERKY